MARYKFPAPTPTASAAALPTSAGTAKTGGSGASAVPVDQYLTVLESRYPRILNTIQTMWGFEELNEFFRKLTIDDRGGRQGFPPEAWDEIQSLWSLHLILVPEKSLF